MEPLLFNSITFCAFLFIIVTFIFFVAQIKRDNSIMDIAYGPIFFITGLITLLYLEANSTLSTIILLAIALWSLRLSVRIFKKNYGKPEDIRYANWRTNWNIHGRWYFLLRSYLQINILQGIIIAIVSLPFIISLSYQNNFNNFFTFLGLTIFFIGLIIEATADYQLDKFIIGKKNGTEKENLMTKGLFKYSRRPNYFGETLIWWGLAIMVLPLPFGYLALISPLMITYIVTSVTGPMLEKIFIEKHPDEYRSYMEKTSYFIPLPPKKVGASNSR